MILKSIAVIGAGPAGMLAAAFAKTEHNRVVLIDRNEKAGKKLYLTGKGRCNITNIAERQEFMRNIPRNPRFLYSCLDGFFNNDIIELIEARGVPTKVERGGRVFPQSDKSSDVIKALQTYTLSRGVELKLNCRVIGLEKKDKGFVVEYKSGEHELFDSVILAMGGVSYPSTGSTGDGYAFAEKLGHGVEPPRPSLISLVTQEQWPGELAGLTLKNVELTAKVGKKTVYNELGEMLFTHTGVSGPLVLSASSRIADAPEGTRLFIDMKPALDEQTLEARIMRDLEANRHKQMKNAVGGLLPARMVPIVLELAGIDPNKTTDSFTKAERHALVATLKAIPLTVKCASPIDEAIITRGGVKVNEIDPKTMESKLVHGLYFAGEIIDVDAYTGGFNLQIAYSTGVAAGRAAALKYGGNTDMTDNASKKIAVAIDGPASAGKSTVAKGVSKRLGIIYIDTGAMYRAVALKAIRMGITEFTADEVEPMLPDTDIEIRFTSGEQHVMLDGEDVNGLIRTQEVSNGASKVSAIPAVRLKLVELQRKLAEKESVVMDGRDIGTYVLPNAEHKFYVTASAEERARRRYLELEAKGQLNGITMERMLEEIIERDERDSTRDFVPLKQADDAVLVDTTELSIDEAIAAVIAVIEGKR